MGNTGKLTISITRNEMTGLKKGSNLVGGALSPDVLSGGGHVTEGHQSGVGHVAEGHQSDGGHVAEGHQRRTGLTQFQCLNLRSQGTRSEVMTSPGGLALTLRSHYPTPNLK